jgi:hypothetical protein
LDSSDTMRFIVRFALPVIGFLACTASAFDTQITFKTCSYPKLIDATIEQLATDLDNGCFTSVDLVTVALLYIELANFPGLPGTCF